MQENNLIALRLIKVFFENEFIKDHSNPFLELALSNLHHSHMGIIRGNIRRENYGLVLSYVDEVLFNNTQPEDFNRVVKGSKEYESSDNESFTSDYGQNFDRYGGYNDFSDDVIDDAFEGDPSATWNVD